MVNFSGGITFSLFAVQSNVVGLLGINVIELDVFFALQEHGVELGLQLSEGRAAGGVLLPAIKHDLVAVKEM